MEDFDLKEWLSTHSDASLLEKLRQAGVSNAYGVPLMALAELGREWSRRSDWQPLADSMGTSYEERLLQAELYGSAAKADKKTFEWLQRFVSGIDSTPLCDATALACLFAVRQPDETLQFVSRMLPSEKPLTQRFAIMMLLDHYMTGDLLGATLELYDTVRPHSEPAEEALVKGYTAAFLNNPQRTHKALMQTSRPKEELSHLVNAMLASPRLTQPLREALKEIVE